MPSPDKPGLGDLLLPEAPVAPAKKAPAAKASAKATKPQKAAATKVPARPVLAKTRTVKTNPGGTTPISPRGGSMAIDLNALAKAGEAKVVKKESLNEVVRVLRNAATAVSDEYGVPVEVVVVDQDHLSKVARALADAFASETDPAVLFGSMDGVEKLVQVLYPQADPAAIKAAIVAAGR